MRASKYNILIDREEASYIYNTLSGALLKVPLDQVAAVHRLLNDGCSDDCSRQLLLQMAIGRMLINDEMDELDTLAARQALSRADESRFALTIVTSLKCNFDCLYCYEVKRRSSSMSKAVQSAICDFVECKLSPSSNFHVLWYGGEPLLGKVALFHLAERFIELTHKAGAEFSSHIVTNGYLLDEQSCRDLAEHKISQVQVTLVPSQVVFVGLNRQTVP